MAGLLAKKIIAPVDFSDLSYTALDRAIEIAGTDGHIDALHVIAPLTVIEPGTMYDAITDETRVEAVVKYMREKMSGDKYARVTPHVTVGDAGREIANFAQTQQADLIVISSHGYGFVKHLLLGSVAERVVRLAHCPVLVLRS